MSSSSTTEFVSFLRSDPEGTLAAYPAASEAEAADEYVRRVGIRKEAFRKRAYTSTVHAWAESVIREGLPSDVSLEDATFEEVGSALETGLQDVFSKGSHRQRYLDFFRNNTYDHWEAAEAIWEFDEAMMVEMWKHDHDDGELCTLSLETLRERGEVEESEWQEPNPLAGPAPDDDSSGDTAAGDAEAGDAEGGDAEAGNAP
jgi:hypothetical protein